MNPQCSRTIETVNISHSVRDNYEGRGLIFNIHAQTPSGEIVGHGSLRWQPGNVCHFRHFSGDPWESVALSPDDALEEAKRRVELAALAFCKG